MALEVEPPDPPSLPVSVSAEEYDDVDVQGQDYRREEIERTLTNGAWEEGFRQWTEHTDVTEEEYEIISELRLIAEFDFFWDAFAGRVGYHAPGLPEDWQERSIHPDLNSWEQVSSINAGLTELGQVISEVVKERNPDWEAEYEAPDELPDF